MQNIMGDGNTEEGVTLVDLGCAAFNPGVLLSYLPVWHAPPHTQRADVKAKQGSSEALNAATHHQNTPKTQVSLLNWLLSVTSVRVSQ